MKKLKIGRILLENRRKRNITQEELAEYMGVSKASVSKWETATTYPDITLLPKLATFFNISIDELIGYEPQMSKADMRRLCEEISHDFSTKPFDEVLAHCREMIKQYYSFAPLLFQIGCLYVNHCGLASSTQKALVILEEAMELFIRVQEESKQLSLIEQAVNMEAFCLLKLGHTQEVIALLKNTIHLRMTPEPLLAEAYQISGNTKEAKQILQAGIYQAAIELLNLLLSYMKLCQEDDFEETCHRILAIAETFQLETLHPTLLLALYFSIAQEWIARNRKEKALAMLEAYTKLAMSDLYPLRLHGDSYFTLLDDWLEETLPLGTNLPKDESMIQKSILEALTEPPIFATLSDDPQFQKMIQKLQIHRRHKSCK